MTDGIKIALIGAIALIVAALIKFLAVFKENSKGKEIKQKVSGKGVVQRSWSR